MAGPVYDRIGGGYPGGRRPDRRITAMLGRALGRAASVVNVGAAPDLTSLPTGGWSRSSRRR